MVAVTAKHLEEATHWIARKLADDEVTLGDAQGYVQRLCEEQGFLPFDLYHMVLKEADHIEEQRRLNVGRLRSWGCET